MTPSAGKMYLLRGEFPGADNKPIAYAYAVRWDRFWVYCSAESLVHSIDLDEEETTDAGYPYYATKALIEEGSAVLLTEDFMTDDEDERYEEFVRFARDAQDGWSMRDMNPDLNWDEED